MAHEPVLVDEAIDALSPEAGEVHVDGTLGGAGYARAILRRAKCRVLGLDRDPFAVERCRAMNLDGLTVRRARFGDLDEALNAEGLGPAQGVVLDLGVSSFQLGEAKRGFSFRFDGPLDMRMEAEGPSAADLLATIGEGELERLLRELGEEPESRRVARAIVQRRAERAIATTGDLAGVVAAAKRRPTPGRDPATRTFQALRMAVNDELGELEHGLEAAERALAPGGRLVVVTFHSLEDRLVKRFVDARGGREVNAPRHLPPVDLPPPRWRWLNKKPVTPSRAEVERNPRARSAKLRVAVRQATADPQRDAPVPSGFDCPHNVSFSRKAA